MVPVMMELDRSGDRSFDKSTVLAEWCFLIPNSFDFLLHHLDDEMGM